MEQEDGKYCNVVDCGNKRTALISLHCIQKNELTANRWKYFLQYVNRKYPTFALIKNIFVCHLHFKAGFIKNTVKGLRTLVQGAYPSIFEGRDLSEMIVKEFPDKDAPKSNSFCVEIYQPPPSPEIIALRSVINAQQVVIQSLKAQNSEQNKKIDELTSTVCKLKSTIDDLKQNTIRVLSQNTKRQKEALKRKNSEIQAFLSNEKKQKLEWSFPEPATEADALLSEIIRRRNMPKSHPYSDKLKEFSFNAHYISPKGYNYIRKRLDYFLPAPTMCSAWTKNVEVSPGILKVAIQYIKASCKLSCKYYALSFDEMAIRQQVIFHRGSMIGCTDYGKLSSSNTNGLAKSALFCLVTELNGSKSFPIAFILTDGLKAQIMADFVKACTDSIVESGGHVLSLSFDGLPANFSALEMLGACFAISHEKYQPYIETNLSEKSCHSRHYIIPDASHMCKLARNVLERCQVLFNGDGKAIRWEYLVMLNNLQENEKLLAANKLSSRHIHFHQKKMNTKLSVQVLSSSTASAIMFCRKIGIPGFDDCEATVEYLRVNDEVFDLLNSRPFGTGKNAPLSQFNQVRWMSVITSAKVYYEQLQVMSGNELVPLHKTKNGTFVKGFVCALSSLELIMDDVLKNNMDLKYIPTYRMSQDVIEIFFGGIRRRLGANDNPNVVQLMYSVRAMLSFKLSVCSNGNAYPQEDLQDKLPVSLPECKNERPGECESYTENEAHLGSLETLSLFVENVVVHIAGFVARKLIDKLTCADCKAVLISEDVEGIKLREDYILLLEKDRGGLVKPSEDLIKVCKVAERLIRIEQAGSSSIFCIKSKTIEERVKRECLSMNIFYCLHDHIYSKAFRKAWIAEENAHKWSLISDAVKIYLKTRLHFVAKTATLSVKPVTNRSKFTKLVHFTGN